MAPKREDSNEENAGVKPKLATSLQGGNGCEMLSKTKVAETACVKSPPVSEVRGNKSVGGGDEGVFRSDAEKEMESLGEVDDELTNLTWLQNCNLLQGMSNVELSEQLPQSPSSKINNAQKSSSNQITNAFGVDELYNPTVHRHAKPPYSFSCLIFMAIEDSQSKALPVKDIYNWIYSHFPYFRSAPNGWRNSIRHNLSLSKCFYKVDKGQNIAKGSLWCVDPKYRHHLLHSLNKTSHAHFNQGIKIPTLNSTPQLSEIETSVAEISHKHLVDPINRLEKRNLISSPSVPKVSNSSLFPYLSKRLTGTSSKNVEEDAAATMLALKNGSLLDCAKQKKLKVPEKIQTELSNLGKRGEKPDVYQVEIEFNKSKPRVTCHFLPPTCMSHGVPISTSRPSKDHTYSTADESENENEMEDEIDDQPLELTTKSQGGQSTNTAQIQNKDDHNWKRKDFESIIVNKSTMAGKFFKKKRCESKVEEVDEEQKIVESADALLNLAGIITRGSESNSQIDLETDERPRRQRKPSRRNLRHLVR